MSESLEIKKELHGDVMVLSLRGNITEDSQIEAITKDIKPLMIIDLKNVQRINSYGIRQWVNVMKELKAKTDQLIFHHCPAAFVEQFNMISNFGGGGVVYSFALPYFCETCDVEETKFFELPGGESPTDTPKVPDAKCSKCSNTLMFNDMEDEYFYFLQHQKGQKIKPAALEILTKLP